MRQIQDQNLAQLLLQLKYTPENKRRQQLEAAEYLCATIDKHKEYPFDFIYYQITGFQPKASMAPPDPINGQALLDDLKVFIAKLSTKTAVPTNEQCESVYTIQALADQWGVSTKTIHRWRRDGLVARKFIFPDGTKRLGISQSAITSFMESHTDRIQKAKAFQRLSRSQIQEIVDCARDLARQTHLSRHQIIARIAGQTRRAHETIRYTLAHYEETHPHQPLFHKNTGILTGSQATHLYDLYKQGTPVPALMRQFKRSRSSIYRIVNQRRASTLMARKIQFVASDEFLDDIKRRHILSKSIATPGPVPPNHFEPFELLGEALLPEYLQVLKDTPILSSDVEMKLFRKYNCLKYMAFTIRHHIDLSHVSSKKLTDIETFLAQAEDIERIIVEANLRLVVSIASRHSSAGTPFSDLVSKGNYALIKAIQEFDYTKGIRFIKRASMTIAKEYAKVSGKSTELSRTKAASLANIQRHLRESADIGKIERMRHSLTQVIRNELNEREQYIILHHFGLIGTGFKKKKKTLQQIGDDLKVTKERIRQIELTALQKLRQCLSSEEFELLTK
jgi:RNA polymerase sigma factor (sigma-70 family)